MKHRQQQQRLFVARKHCARLQVEWSDEDDALLAGRRCVADPVTTTVNKHKVRALREIFPTTDRDVLQDVLIAAHFEVDVAAAMLGDLVCVPTQQPHERVAADETPTTHQIALTAPGGAAFTELDFEMTSVEDDDDWSEVSAVVQQQSSLPAVASNEPHPWIMVHDEWEVVGMDGEKVETFADKLRRAGANAPLLAATPLPKLSVVSSTPSRALQRTAKKLAAGESAALESSSVGERSVKSFGARKRRFLKTRA